jgi:hypothetical protein
MNILPQTWLSDLSPTFQITLSEQLPISTESDPLIDTSGQHIVFWGAVLLAILVVVIIRILSPRIEHAIVTAVVLSLGLISLFFVLGY